MIITDKLRWMHLPKTAGTSTENLFIASGVPILWNDPQTSSLKHLPVEEHPSVSQLPLFDQSPIINIRRLPYWLLSNFHHKRNKMNLDIPSEPMRKGLFWRHRDQSWLPADWWLERLSVTSDFQFIRVEYLKKDFLSVLNGHHAISLSNRLSILFGKSKNINSYQRGLSEWFTSDDLSKIYSTNPYWASLEMRLYGQLVSLGT